VRLLLRMARLRAVLNLPKFPWVISLSIVRIHQFCENFFFFFVIWVQSHSKFSVECCSKRTRPRGRRSNASSPPAPQRMRPRRSRLGLPLRYMINLTLPRFISVTMIHAQPAGSRWLDIDDAHNLQPSPTSPCSHSLVPSAPFPSHSLSASATRPMATQRGTNFIELYV
jgi:hypothetical protein